MSNFPATNEQSSIIEQVIATGNLANLTAEQRTSYFRRVCESLGLNPLTRPFEYITLNGKLTLYARKDATDQLRRIRGVSIGKPDIVFKDGWIIVTVEAKDKDGRTDSDVGMVKETDMRGDLGNALMKAVTKAKRRVTLSICGLGILDETEVETIPDAVHIPVEIPAPAAPVATDQARWTAFCKEHKYGAAQIEAALGTTSVASWMRENGQLIEDAMNRMTAWSAGNTKQTAVAGK